MKVKFKSRLQAIDWIANYTEDEGEFEVLREQLNYNFIYTGKFFIKVEKKKRDIISLGSLFRPKK